MNWKCPACGNEDNSDDVVRCICGQEVEENANYEIADKEGHETLDPKTAPSKCPQCGHENFIKLQPERGTTHTIMTILFFILDLFTPGPRRSYGLEVSNMGRPGWMCENCGREIRVKTK